MINNTFNPLPIFFICLLLLQSCATPANHFDQEAKNRNFSIISIKSQIFEHKIFANQAALHSDGQELHVYLDGDGTPWIQKKWIADDPTSRNPLILDLMAEDTEPAILLGRPCYHGSGPSEACHNELWTSHRYNQKIVDSMITALKKWLRKSPSKKRIIFIGYSGGGVLATLMAPHFSETYMLITIAANLDTAAWSLYHHYPPLVHSLNPVDKPALPKSIRQLHITGSEDKIVPPTTIKTYTKKQQNSFVLQIPNQHHHCCWLPIWKKIINSL